MLFKVQKGGRIAGRRYNDREKNVSPLLSLCEMRKYRYRGITKDNRIPQGGKT